MLGVSFCCDVCGKLYELYNVERDRKNTNGLMFLNMDYKREYFGHDRIDCCPECMESIRKYLKSLGWEEE